MPERCEAYGLLCAIAFFAVGMVWDFAGNGLMVLLCLSASVASAQVLLAGTAIRKSKERDASMRMEAMYYSIRQQQEQERLTEAVAKVVGRYNG